ncbi:hypothetical protein GCM10010409_22400 [Mycolicibacterium diernhoferi]
MHQHVELGERLGGRFDGFLVGQVQWPGRCPETRGEGVQMRRRAARQKQRVSGREGGGDGRSDPAAGTGYQGCGHGQNTTDTARRAAASHY